MSFSFTANDRRCSAAVRFGFRCVIVGIALIAFFHKSGHSLPWLLLSLLLPAGCLLWPSPHESLRRLWLSVCLFAEQGGRCPWRATLVFVTGPAFFFLLSNERTLTNGDSWPVVPTAAGLVTSGRGDLDAALPHAPACYGRPMPYSVLRTEAGSWSSYPAGMVAFALPVTTLARGCGLHIDRPVVQQRLEKFTAAAVTATALGLFFLIALHVTPPVPALVATGLLATGSALTSTCGQALWQQGGVVFWMMVLILAEFRLAERPVAASLWQGVAAAMMLACRLSSALLLLAFGIWVLARAPRRALAVAGVALVAYLPWAVFHWSVYGNPLGPSTGQLASSWWSWEPMSGLAGLLVSPSRGLLVYQPWVVLALPGLWLGRGTTRLPPGWLAFCVGAILLHLILVANWRIWWGGHCWGSRLLAEVVPLLVFLALPAIAALARSWRGQVFLTILAVASFLPHAPVLYGRALEWNRGCVGQAEMLWSWRAAPFLHPFRH